MQFDFPWGKWEIVASNGQNQHLELSAFAAASEFLQRPFESPQGSIFYDFEALLGHMTVMPRSDLFFRIIKPLSN